jgi:dolichol-phosphate mannosyltransferase
MLVNSSPSQNPQISLVIPALNEAENIPSLVAQIAEALRGRSYEILIVDDNSKDATPQVCAELSKTHPLNLIVRTQPKDGLGGAVLHGFAQARGEYLVVMDADLQHPPAKLPELLAPLERGESDFTLGSRHVPGASVGEEWGAFRQLNSAIATLLARPFAGKTRDPMSGFFAMKRSTYERAERLTPLGYKIGLELMCKCRVHDVREVPIHFGLRERGESKLSVKEQFRYLEHLSRLYDFCYPRLSPITKFLIVEVLGWIVGFGIYQGLHYSNLSEVAQVVIAYLGVVLVTAVFHRRYIRTQREFLVTRHPWGDFVIIAVAEVVACAVTAAYVAHRVADLKLYEAFVLGFGAAMLIRYVMRKELMLDIRGLRHDFRKGELT